MLAGVTITDPASTVIEADVRIEADSVIDPYTFLRGRVEVGIGCRVGPMTTLKDCVLGNEVTVVHSYLEGCEVLDDCTVGPFAYLRPGTLLRERAKAGTFVEVKNSDIGVGTKIPHLSYVGDADVGSGTNLGAGNITANYDGRSKHRTVIGKNVRTGVDTAFVAPGQRRRQRVHCCRIGDHRRRPGGRAGHRESSPAEYGGLRRGSRARSPKQQARKGTRQQ